MRGMIFQACLSGLVLMVCGCATIVKGTTQQVSITTPGAPGAQCKLFSSAIGEKTVTTPVTIVLEKSRQNISVTCTKRRFQDGVGIIPSHTEGMTAGNVVVGGPIGLGIDAISGAMNRYNDANQFTMVPIPGCQA